MTGLLPTHSPACGKVVCITWKADSTCSPADLAQVHCGKEIVSRGPNEETRVRSAHPQTLARPPESSQRQPGRSPRHVQLPCMSMLLLSWQYWRFQDHNFALSALRRDKSATREAIEVLGQAAHRLSASARPVCSIVKLPCRGVALLTWQAANGTDPDLPAPSAVVAKLIKDISSKLQRPLK